MRTAKHRQRGGVGSALLEYMLEQARLIGFTRLSLETGSGEFFEPARRLYAKFGFDYCEPFGDYLPDPLSVFMTRSL
jgi:putative acetyltransferase